MIPWRRHNMSLLPEVGIYAKMYSRKKKNFMPYLPIIATHIKEKQVATNRNLQMPFSSVKFQEF